MAGESKDAFPDCSHQHRPEFLLPTGLWVRGGSGTQALCLPGSVPTDRAGPGDLTIAGP